MTQARTPAGSTGSEYLASTQLPTALTWPTTPSRANRMMDLVQTHKFRDVSDASANFTYTFAAPNNGHIQSLRAVAGTVAGDGTNGIKLVVTNESNSAEVIGSFGLGTNTNAAAATNSAAIAASVAGELANTTAKNFNKGDIVKITATRDGTTFVLTGELVLEFYVPSSSDD
jgi:hypothetical protein